MKKFLIALSLALASVTGAHAQNIIIDNPSNTSYFGIRASLDVTIPGDIKNGHIHTDAFNNGIGFSIGGIYNIPLLANLYFEPGFTLYYDTFGVHSEFISSNFTKSSIREFGFNIPLMVGYHFDFNPCKLYVFTGPEFRVGVHGKIHSKAVVDGVQMSGSEGMYDAFNRADISWRLGVGCSFSNYYVGLSGAAGMCNNIKHRNPGTMHRNAFNLTLGYNF